MNTCCIFFPFVSLPRFFFASPSEQLHCEYGIKKVHIEVE